MRLASFPSSFPRPAQLPALAVTPAVDLARDVVELDGVGSNRLPRAIEEGGIHLEIQTTSLNEEGRQILDHYASDSDYANAWRMRREGFNAALTAAQLLSAKTGEEAIAVVQAAKTGTRYLVPLGVWSPWDESMLPFEMVGGTPYWNGAKDHLLMRNAGSADVEAVVFAGGSEWINTTGHPVRLPKAQASASA